MATEPDDVGDESIYEALFHESSVPTVVVDLVERRVVDANVAAERFLGLSRSQVLGVAGADLLVEPVPDAMLRRRGLSGEPVRLVREVRTAEGPKAVEIVQTPTGREGLVFVQALPVAATSAAKPDGRGAESDDDASPGLTRETAIRLLDTAPVPMVVIDLAAREIVRLNDAAEDLFGVPARSMIGRPSADYLIDPGDADEIRDELTAGEARRRRRRLAEVITTAGSVEAELDYVLVPDSTLAAVQIQSLGSTGRRRRPDAPPPTAVEASSQVADLARRARIACGAALLALGAVVLVVGWWAGVERVTTIAPDLSSMKANTAVGFLCFGIALVVGDSPGTRTARHIALAFVGAIGLVTVAQYAFDVDFGIDELLVSDPDSALDSTPGRMGLNTAICYSLMGPSMLWGEASRSRRVLVAGQVGMLLAGAIAYLALLGYVFGASGGRGLASTTEMALHTSVAVLVGCFGGLVGMTGGGVLAPVVAPYAGGRVARTALPVGLAVVVVSAALVSALAAVGWIEQVELELAFFAVSVSVLFAVVVLAVADQTNQLDAGVQLARRDLAAVLAAFNDEHYRVTAAGLAHPVSGAGLADAVPVGHLVPDGIVDQLQAALRSTRQFRSDTALTFGRDDRDVELRVAPLPGDEVAVSIRDVSELAAARDELRRLARSLETEVAERTAELEAVNAGLSRSNADLEQFAYLASHDLREPLRMVSTFVSKLADRLGDDLDDRSKEYVHYAVDGAERMAELIDGLLQYSRAGRSEVELTDVELTDVLADVLATVDLRVMEQGATIALAGDLPTVRADPIMLRQILQNLVGNSLKFVDPDRAPAIEIEATRVGGMVEVSVGDNGIGIPVEHRARVFQMFQRLHGRSTYEGTGIGLALVQRLVDAHGGRVWIDDEHGPPGVRLVFTVPSSRPTTDRERP